MIAFSCKNRIGWVEEVEGVEPSAFVRNMFTMIRKSVQRIEWSTFWWCMLISHQLCRIYEACTTQPVKRLSSECLHLGAWASARFPNNGQVVQKHTQYWFWTKNENSWRHLLRHPLPSSTAYTYTASAHRHCLQPNIRTRPERTHFSLSICFFRKELPKAKGIKIRSRSWPFNFSVTGGLHVS